jgi:hypothetical protein
MNVLIVSKTRMHRGTVCVGGLLLTNPLISVRLLEANGSYPPASTPYDISQVWDIVYTLPATTTPPHAEDIKVTQKSLVQPNSQILPFLLQNVRIWRGDPSTLFDGMLGVTGKSKGYIAHSLGLPAMSTGYWIPDQPLQLLSLQKPEYMYPGATTGPALLPYVGLAPPIAPIPVGTLVRISLAKWWRPRESTPDTEERCYLQLSGWYL